MALKIVYCLAILLTAIALVPGGAHLFALPNKITLSQSDYFTVQRIYRGWALLGVLTIITPIANATLTAMLWHAGQPFWPPLIATLATLMALLVFFLWVYPANQATANWITVPDNWATLRTHWEYGHAASALLTFVALICVTFSALNRS